MLANPIWKLRRLAYVPDLLIDGMTWHGDHADWRDQQEISLEDNQHGGHPATIIIWLKPRSIQSTV